MLVLALFVAGELAASAHFAFVGHRVCAEHGELEHAPVRHGDAGLHAPLAATDAEHACAQDSARGAVLEAAGDAERGHDHCALGDRLAPRTAPHAFHPESGLGLAIVAPHASSMGPDARPFPLHLLAPKHSPPAAV